MSKVLTAEMADQWIRKNLTFSYNISYNYSARWYSRQRLGLALT